MMYRTVMTVACGQTVGTLTQIIIFHLEGESYDLVSKLTTPAGLPWSCISSSLPNPRRNKIGEQSLLRDVLHSVVQ